MKLNKNIAISDSGFIFNPSTGDSFSVNPVGQHILSMLKDGKQQLEIIETILAEYHVDKDTAEKDFEDFAKMLNYNKLINTDKDE